MDNSHHPHSSQPKVIIEIQALEKVSPPFEGGVAGIVDYQIFTTLISRPGWLIYSFLCIFYIIKSKIIFNRKSFKTFQIITGTVPTWERQTNQPPRPQKAFSLFDYHCYAATPPSKGGETIYPLYP
jgi:hypothetical protein